MNKKKVIIPLPSRDFDPTEAAVSWKIIRDAGHDVEFATPDGKRPYADPLMISGEGLDPWGWIPLLKKIIFVGFILRADRFGRKAYKELERDANFLNPKKYEELHVENYDGLLLPGGHASGMIPYLEDKTLQSFVADFFETGDGKKKHRPVGAICHGVVLALRSISRATGKSVLYGKKTTALTWKQENTAWLLTRFFARFWDPEYYRTYSERSGEPRGFRSVEMEIKRALENEEDFLDVPPGIKYYFKKTGGLAKDRLNDSRPAWVVEDGNYISARWPGDVHTFALKFTELLNDP